MTSKTILNVIDIYQKARLCFAQSIADLSSRAGNVDVLLKAGAIDLLKPLLSDPCPQIQQCAAIALGRMVSFDINVAREVLESGILPLLVDRIAHQKKHQKKATMFVLRTLCKHGPELANLVIAGGGLVSLVTCLEDLECYVKESAAWGIGYIARHDAELAQCCVDAGCLPLLVLCLQEPDLALKQVTTSVLSDIAKHNLELAQGVVDIGAVPHLVKNLSHTDEKLKKQTLCALTNCVKHNAELAEMVVEAEIFPTVLMLLVHQSQAVRRNAACLIRDIVKHNLELAQLVVNTGGVGALVEVVALADDETKIPAITALGFMAGHSEQMALSVMGCNLVLNLADILRKSHNEDLLSVTAWTLGQIGKHSPETANAVASTDVFEKLTDICSSKIGSEDLQCKAKNALKLCLQKSMLLSALEPLLFNAPSYILKYVLGQYSKVLPEDPKARRLFVTSGALKRVQEIEVTPGTALCEYVNIINACFPEEIVRFYSPGYSDTLLEKVEQYSPQILTVLRETSVQNTDIQTDLTTIVDDTDYDANIDCQM